MKKTILIFAFLFSSVGLADQLNLYLMPARPNPVSWKSPRGVMWSGLYTTFFNNYHTIGHVTVHLECDATSDHPAVDILTGSTSADETSSKLVLFQGSAMGVLFYDLPGRREPREGIYKDIQKLAKLPGRLSSVTYQISPSTCRRLSDYYAEYLQNNYHAHYGLPNRPRYREGGGCSAFGSSFVEVAGLLDAETKAAWSTTVNVPEALIGYPFYPRHIGLLAGIVNPLAKRWAREDEPHRDLFFFEPEYIHQWIVRLHQGVVAGEVRFQDFPVIDSVPTLLKKMAAEKNKTTSINIDMRSVPTPTEPAYLQ